MPSRSVSAGAGADWSEAKAVPVARLSSRGSEMMPRCMAAVRFTQSWVISSRSGREPISIRVAPTWDSTFLWAVLRGSSVTGVPITGPPVTPSSVCGHAVAAWSYEVELTMP
jgi:hypothetical protein